MDNLARSLFNQECTFKDLREEYAKEAFIKRDIMQSFNNRLDENVDITPADNNTSYQLNKLIYFIENKLGRYFTPEEYRYIDSLIEYSIKYCCRK